jgi:glycosyltransferase 2 family protein
VGDGAPTQQVADRGVRAPAAVIGLRFRFFAAPPGQPRARRGTDVVLLVVGAVGLAISIAAYPPSSLEQSLEAFLAALPGWLDPVWGFLTDVLWLWAIVLVAVALFRRRLVVVGQAVAALVLAAAVALWSARLATGSWPDIAASIFGTAHAVRFPAGRAAEATAVILTVGPHLARPVRSVGRWLLVLGLLGTVITWTPLGTIAATLTAIAAAAAVRLASGTSIGRPGLDDVAAGLAQLGIRPGRLEEAERQVAGVFHVRGVDEDGRPLLVKVYGRDAYDTQLVARLWRRLWFRGGSLPIRLGRLEAAEHEAFVTLLVRAGGLATHEVVTAAATANDDALLVLRGDARPLAGLAPEELGDDLLSAAWNALGLLNQLKIAHLQIDPQTTAIVSGDVGFLDFGAGTVAPTALQLATDRVQLLLTTASLVGSERALAAAAGALGDDQLAALLPYLQPGALTTSLRKALKPAGIDVDEIRAQAARTAGVDPPELERLRRVSVRALIQMPLLAFAAYTIVEAAAGIDWGDVLSTVREASWAWIVLGFLVAQLPRVTQALSTLGSVPSEMPFGPVYGLQLATGYMNVALPSGLARMAVNIRFFQRQGLSAPTAIASGVIDSLASTVVQAPLLAVLLIFTESSLPLDLPSPPTGGLRTLLWVLLGALVVSVAGVVIVRRFRSTISERIRRWWPDVRGAVSAIRASHKLALLLLGSLGTDILFAIALGLFVRSFGYHVNLAALLVINISVSLLASFIPVPGGVGVAEFGLTLGLTSAGMTPETAIAAVLLYRISTFYLPPIWGFPAMLWLQRNRYL